MINYNIYRWYIVSIGVKKEGDKVVLKNVFNRMTEDFLEKKKINHKIYLRVLHPPK